MPEYVRELIGPLPIPSWRCPNGMPLDETKISQGFLPEGSAS